MSDTPKLADLRKSYERGSLDVDDVATDPLSPIRQLAQTKPWPSSCPNPTP
jgi:hypothetical protein